MQFSNIEVDSQLLDEVCRRFGIARLDVFGSTARDEAATSSDVDILYELLPGTRLGWGIESLTDQLEELFGRKVDLVSRNALHHRLRDAVLAEALPLYHAGHCQPSVHASD